MTPDEARQYLNGLSFHRGRTGDVAFMHPDFAVKLASAIQYAKTHGLPDAGLLSGYREASDHPSSYDEKGWSSHEYGLAADVSGIGPAGSSTAQQWRQIATQFGLYSPYDPNGSEWNHWQLNPKPLEQDSALLNSLVAAKRTGDPTKMWAAFTPSTGVTSPVTNAVGAGPIAQGPDNRTLFFNSLVKDGLTPQQALGALWSLGGESHPNIDTSAYNPNDPGGAIGAGQWNGPRRLGLEQFAASVGKPVNDPQTQADYLSSELTGQGPAAKFAIFQPGVLDALKQAKTPEEAAKVWTTLFERPKIDNTEARIRNGAAVGSLDANGNFVPGTATAAKPGAAPPPTGGAAAGAAPPVAQPPSELAQIGSALGSALSGLVGGNSGLSGSPGVMLDSSMDQPAIRTPALMADFSGAPNPVPANIAMGAGATPLGAQLGALGAVAPDPMLENPQVAPSITAGAPSMTSMLGGVGGAQPGNVYDPRRPAVIQPGLAYSRLA